MSFFFYLPNQVKSGLFCIEFWSKCSNSDFFAFQRLGGSLKDSERYTCSTLNMKGEKVATFPLSNFEIFFPVFAHLPITSKEDKINVFI